MQEVLSQLAAMVGIYKSGLIPSAGMAPLLLGLALLAITLVAKLGRYQLDKATTLSQISATAVTQLQANQKLTQDELTATRAAYAEANRQITELTQRAAQAMDAVIKAERTVIAAERAQAQLQGKLDDAERTIASLGAALSEAKALIQALPTRAQGAKKP